MTVTLGIWIRWRDSPNRFPRHGLGYQMRKTAVFGSGLILVLALAGELFADETTDALVEGVIAQVKTDTDQSGKRHHAKVHGARWVKNARGLQNGAYQFDGKSKLDLGDIMNDAKLPITLALWLRPDEFPPKGGMGAYPFCSDRWDGKGYVGVKVSLPQRGPDAGGPSIIGNMSSTVR